MDFWLCGLVNFSSNFNMIVDNNKNSEENLCNLRSKIGGIFEKIDRLNLRTNLLTKFQIFELIE